MGGRWRRRRGATAARDLGLPNDGDIASRSADAVRRPLDGDDVRIRVTPGGRLAEGLVIDASIVARLLGLRLLTLDARIRFVPAQFTASGPSSPPTRPTPDHPWPTPAHPWPPLGDRWPPGHRWQGPAWAPPGGLDDAANLLADASRTLDHVRRDLSASLRPVQNQEIRDQEVRDEGARDQDVRDQEAG